ncbi:hypothetical protein M422DRAFT_773957, partial [Sphaerobolus stellatus SS14]
MSSSSSRSPSPDSQRCSSQESQMLPDQPVTLRTPPPADHIQLVLYNDHSTGHDFYLEIPIWVVTQHCLKPFKYLRYIGWAILGVEGIIKDGNLDEVSVDDGAFTPGKTYFYVLPADVQWKSSPSESSNTRGGFRSKVLARDGSCVFTHVDDINAEVAHIIPFARGDGWLQIVVRNRPAGIENITNLNSVNDVRNGFTAYDHIHKRFDSREAVILKTPNPILDPADIHPRLDVGTPLPNNKQYPRTARYTLQIFNRTLLTQLWGKLPDNVDAAFLKPSLNGKGNPKPTLPKPSALLLHYNFGAAALKQWGRNKVILSGRPGIPRPPPPTQDGNHRIFHQSDRQTAINKRKDKAPEEQNMGGAGAGGLQEAPTNQEWDEDDVMLYFWGNTPV